MESDHRLSLGRPWHIGALQMASRLALAPMAGVSIRAYRRQGVRFGAGLVCSEMVSAAGLHYASAQTRKYLEIAPDKHPIALQIFGSDPALMAEAARMVEDAGADLVDINFGARSRRSSRPAPAPRCSPSRFSPAGSSRRSPARCQYR